MEGTKQIAQRIVNAENGFVEIVQNITGCSREEGFKALRTLIKAKAVRLDPIIGRYSVKHGAFLERGALLNAIAY